MDSLKKLFVFSIANAILNILVSLSMIVYDYRMFYAVIVLSIVSIVYVYNISKAINAIEIESIRETMKRSYIKPILYISIILYILFYLYIAMWYLVF
jgi:cell division protein FtsW (lipid II flippase)